MQKAANYHPALGNDPDQSFALVSGYVVGCFHGKSSFVFFGRYIYHSERL